MLGTFNLGEITRVETGDNGTLYHDEASSSIVLGTTKSGQSVTRILSDDTEVFVLLVYWVNRADIY